MDCIIDVESTNFNVKHFDINKNAINVSDMVKQGRPIFIIPSNIHLSSENIKILVKLCKSIINIEPIIITFGVK